MTTDSLFMKEGDNYYCYRNEHLGTPQKMTGVNGGVLWSAKYSSFGKAEVDASSSVTNDLRFPGQYGDEETGLHYNYHRYYDPKTGRYSRTDPLNVGTSHIYVKQVEKWITDKPVNQFFNFEYNKLASPIPPLFTNNIIELSTVNKLLNNPQKQNPYVYVQNSPINLIDSTGLNNKCKDLKFACMRLCVITCFIVTRGHPIAVPICIVTCKVYCDYAYKDCDCKKN